MIRVTGLRGLTPVALVKEALRHFRAHDMTTYAAAVTYYVLFSLFPFVIFFIALLGFLELSQVFDWLRQRSQAFFLDQTMQQINQVLDQLQQRRMGMLSFGAIAALLAASHGMLAMMNALNAVYGVTEARPIWKRYLLSALYTLTLGTLIIVAIMLVIVTPQAIQMLAEHIGMAHVVATLWVWWLRWPLIVLLLTVIVALVYSIGPDAEQRFRFVTPGAFLAVLAWIGISQSFNFYVRNVANYDAVYGSVGTLIVLLFYFFICSVIVLLGAEINAVIEHHDPIGKNAGDKRVK